MWELQISQSNTLHLLFGIFWASTGCRFFNSWHSCSLLLESFNALRTFAKKKTLVEVMDGMRSLLVVMVCYFADDHIDAF